jgi:ribosome-binding factor A
MGSGNPRRVRVAQSIRDALAQMLPREVKDARVTAVVGMISINHVELNSDMSIARVYVSFYGDDEKSIGRAMEGLERAQRFLRGPLGRELQLARCPQLRFVRDESPDFHERLRDIIKSDEERASTREDTPDDAEGAGE